MHDSPTPITRPYSATEIVNGRTRKNTFRHRRSSGREDAIRPYNVAVKRDQPYPDPTMSSVQIEDIHGRWRPYRVITHPSGSRYIIARNGAHIRYGEVR